MTSMADILDSDVCLEDVRCCMCKRLAHGVKEKARQACSCDNHRTRRCRCGFPASKTLHAACSAHIIAGGDKPSLQRIRVALRSLPLSLLFKRFPSIALIWSLKPQLAGAAIWQWFLLRNIIKLKKNVHQAENVISTSLTWLSIPLKASSC